MPSTRASLTTLTAFGLLLSLNVACEQEAAKDDTKSEAPPPPAIKVELPAPPDFDEGKSPETWEDGCLLDLRPCARSSTRTSKRVRSRQRGAWSKAYIQDIYVAARMPRR